MRTSHEGAAAPTLRAWMYQALNRDATELVVVRDWRGEKSELLCGDGQWREYGEYSVLADDGRTVTFQLTGFDQRHDRLSAETWADYAPAWLRYHPDGEVVRVIDGALRRWDLRHEIERRLLEGAPA